MRLRIQKHESARGYVLVIVMIVGIAVSLAAAALINASGGARVNAMHSDNGAIAEAIAQAGMNHALAYVEAVSSTSADFDGLLDIGLDADCTSGILTATDIDAASAGDDLVPALDGADIVTPASLNGRRFARVSDYNGGAYLIRFDDDDDDTIRTDTWQEITGNNDITDAGAVDCYEGSRPQDAADETNHAGGAENRLRDRNRSVYITVVGVYPGDDADAATHRVVMRSLYTGPKPPTLAGIQIKGNLKVSGTNTFLACSPIGSVEVDGKAETNGGPTVCASGNSNADRWKDGWENAECLGTGLCEGIPAPFGPITPAPGQLDEPGPELPNMPHVWNEADEHIDWSRECVFWIDDGAGRTGGSSFSKSIWWWDADRSAGGGNLCSDFEGTGGSFPGPPRPDQAGTSYRGCWSPLILDGGTPQDMNPDPYGNPTGAITNLVFNVFSGFASDPYDDGKCWSPPWYDASGPSAFYERPPTGLTSCSWYPQARVGEYITCDDSPTAAGTPLCSTLGMTIPSPLGIEPAFGSLNAKLQAMGIPRYPHNTRLTKPNWATACTIEYPPDFFGTPQTYGCKADAAGQGCRFPNVTNPALTLMSGTFFPKPADEEDVRAVPAGVYFYTNGLSLSGAPTSWSAPRPWNPANSVSGGDPNPLNSLDAYPLMTIVSDKTLLLQQADYFFGIGQISPKPWTGGQNAPRWGRWATWITDKLDLNGGGSMAVAGSIYARDQAIYRSSVKYYVYGEMYTNKDVNVGGGATLYWLYQVPLASTGASGFGGTLPTTFRSAQ